MRRLSIILLGLTSCASSGEKSIDSQPAKLGGYLYQAPADWKQAESHGPRSVTTQWTPDADSNDRKESIVVTRTEVNPAVARAGIAAVEKYLTDAQHELPKLQFTQAASTFKTEQGLIGAKLEVDFTPPGLKTQYHRVHAVVLDGGNLVHVTYTALRPDYDEAALKLVLNSLHKVEG